MALWKRAARLWHRLWPRRRRSNRAPRPHQGKSSAEKPTLRQILDKVAETHPGLQVGTIDGGMPWVARYAAVAATLWLGSSLWAAHRSDGPRAIWPPASVLEAAYWAQLALYLVLLGSGAAAATGAAQQRVLHWTLAYGAPLAHAAAWLSWLFAVPAVETLVNPAAAPERRYLVAPVLLWTVFTASYRHVLGLHVWDEQMRMGMLDSAVAASRAARAPVGAFWTPWTRLRLPFVHTHSVWVFGCPLLFAPLTLALLFGDRGLAQASSGAPARGLQAWASSLAESAAGGPTRLDGAQSSPWIIVLAVFAVQSVLLIACSFNTYLYEWAAWVRPFSRGHAVVGGHFGGTAHVWVVQ